MATKKLINILITLILIQKLKKKILLKPAKKLFNINLGVFVSVHNG